MRAIVMTAFGGPEVLRLTDIPEPEPEHGQIRVRLYAAGVNPAEAYIRTGQYAFFKPTLPYTPAVSYTHLIGPRPKATAAIEQNFRKSRRQMPLRRSTSYWVSSGLNMDTSFFWSALCSRRVLGKRHIRTDGFFFCRTCFTLKPFRGCPSTA